MKSSRRTRFYSSYTATTVTYVNKDDQITPTADAKTTEIPIPSTDETPIFVPVHLHPSLRPPEPAAATKIQSAYRSYRVRTLVRKISAVNAESNRLERLIQRQETVDAIRRDEKEKLRMNEALMSLLLQLDSVPGIDPAVRELRRSVSRRIVGLQEILDGVADARVRDPDEFMRSWDETIAAIEEKALQERGGGKEMERFCAESLGFRCMEKFLRGV